MILDNYMGGADAGVPPTTEPARQYYFMERAAELIRKNLRRRAAPSLSAFRPSGAR